jgi:hypothetical protein
LKFDECIGANSALINSLLITEIEGENYIWHQNIFTWMEGTKKAQSKLGFAVLNNSGI